MNIVEKLMAADRGEVEKIEQREIVSRRLSKILGEEGTKVTIRAVDSSHFLALSASGLDRNGNVDYGKAYDVNAKIVAAGLVDPDLKNGGLLKHLGVATPDDAAKKIFKGEVNKISAAIARLSGFENEDGTDEEIKNL